MPIFDESAPRTAQLVPTDNELSNCPSISPRLNEAAWAVFIECALRLINPIKVADCHVGCFDMLATFFVLFYFVQQSFMVKISRRILIKWQKSFIVIPVNWLSVLGTKTSHETHDYSTVLEQLSVGC
ncbi:hypothetical protein D3C84_1067060 [compost metagenome]